MQSSQVSYEPFKDGAQGSNASAWMFKLEFGIVHAMNCSVCRSYMAHVAIANHSGDASFKDALNERETRVSAAFLHGFESGRQTAQKHDDPMPSCFRDERDKALKGLGDAKKELGDVKKELAILRDRVSALELAHRHPVPEEGTSKRRDESTGSSIKYSSKSDVSGERILLSPSEDLDYDNSFSTPFMYPADNQTLLIIPDLPTAVQDKNAPQAEVPDSANPLQLGPVSIGPLSETNISDENVTNSWAQFVEASFFAISGPKEPSSQPSALILSNLSISDQGSLSTAPPEETSNTSMVNVPKSWAPLSRASSSATNRSGGPSQPSTSVFNLSEPSSSSPSNEFLEETDGSTVNTNESWAKSAKASSSTTPQSAKASPRPWLTLPNSPSDQQLPSIQPSKKSDVSTAQKPKKKLTQLAKASANPEAGTLSPQPSTRPPTPLISSNQQTSIVEPPGGTNVATTSVTKSLAQVTKASTSATPKSAVTSPQPSKGVLGLSSTSEDQQSPSVLTTNSCSQLITTTIQLEALMKAALAGDASSLKRIRAFCGTAHRTTRSKRTELQRYALLHWRSTPPSVLTSVASSVPAVHPLPHRAPSQVPCQSSSAQETVQTTVGDGMFSTEIQVDASAWGIGFVMDGLWLAWKFSDSLVHSGDSIDNNWAEMLAVEVGLWTVVHWVFTVIQKEGDVISSLEIIVRSDNAGVVKAIERGHSNHPPQQDVLLRILDIISDYDIQLTMKWIPGGNNLADGPSRGVPGPASDLLPFTPPLPSYLSDTLLLA